MAFPTILFDSATGSDTAASGAGPATALTGAAGVTATDTGSHVGCQVNLDGSPDLSGVATDGSHVLYYADSTASGRNFAAIVGKGNSGTPSAFVQLNSGQALGFTGPSTHGVNGVSAAWAIGGKRATFKNPASSYKLIDNNGAAGDMQAGWTLQFASGHSETVGLTDGNGAGQFTFRVSGSDSAGPCAFQAAPGAGTMPKFVFQNNSKGFFLNGTNCLVKGLELQSLAASTASVAIYTAVGINEIVGCKIADSTNKFWEGIEAQTGTVIRDCEVAYTTSTPILLLAGSYNYAVLNNRVHHWTGGTAGIYVNTDMRGLLLAYNRVYLGTGSGIQVSGLNAGAINALSIVSNTVDSCTLDGVRLTDNNDGLSGVRLLNNNLTNNGTGGTGYGVNFTAAADVLLAAERTLVLNNNTHGNATNAYHSATAAYANAACPWASGDPGVDPTYAAAATGNFTPSNTADRAAYPTDHPSYGWIGSTQPLPAAGGAGGLRRVGLGGGMDL